MKARQAADLWEKTVDRFAKSPWSSVALWGYGLAWAIAENWNIGWDGFLTIALGEVALSIRRWQGRQ
jgi:hypothetical protein